MVRHDLRQLLLHHRDRGFDGRTGNGFLSVSSMWSSILSSGYGGVHSAGIKQSRGVMLTTLSHLLPSLRSRSYTSSLTKRCSWRLARRLYFPVVQPVVVQQSAGRNVSLRDHGSNRTAGPQRRKKIRRHTNC